jgi:hypothetical protein
MKELLAQSNNYKLFASYEEVTLEGGLIDHLVIAADFYGGAICGVIDKNEKWCVLGGNGLVVYYLIEPFHSYTPKTESAQWKELFTEEKDTPWYPETAYQFDETTVRLVMDIHGTARGVYDFNVYSLALTKLL